MIGRLREPQFIRVSKNHEKMVISGKSLHPVIAAGSKSHICILTDHNEIYYIKNEPNLDHNITFDDDSDNVKKVTTSQQAKIMEIACGDNYTVVCYESNTVVLLTNDKEIVLDGFKCPRGLTSNDQVFVFVSNYSTMHVYRGEECISKTEIPGQKIIDTAISETSIFALSSSGMLFYAPISNVNFTQVPFDFKVSSVFSLPDGVLVTTSEGTATYFTNLFSKVSVMVPYGFHIIHAIYFGGLYCIDKRGRVASADLNQPRVPLKIHTDNKFLHSCIAASETELLLFNGLPSHIPYTVLSKELSFLNDIDAAVDGQKILAFCTKTVFLENRRITFNEFRAAASIINRLTFGPKSLHIFVTNGSRLIGVSVDPEETFEYNFLPGDIVDVPGGGTATFAGVGAGRVWLTPFGNRLVFSCTDTSRLVVRERKGHQVKRLQIDGIPVTVDVTPEFCARFGCTIGDLYLIGVHGICEFVGVYGGHHAFLDIGTNTYFGERSFDFECCRTMSDREVTRRILTADGAVDVSVNSKGRLFLACDRVRTPIGVGTVVGFANDYVYVQTDQMRLSGLGGHPFSVRELSLVRRVRGVARRSFTHNGSPILLSLSTDDAVFGLMAGDRVMVRSQLGTIAGTAGRTLFVHRDGTAPTHVHTADDAHLMYRADLLGGAACASAEVGSPALGANTVLLPGDLVRIEGRGPYLFRGISRGGPLFMSTDTQETTTTSFTALWQHDSFEILKRPALLG